MYTSDVHKTSCFSKQIHKRFLVKIKNKNTELSCQKISFCNDSFTNVNGKDKSVTINFILHLANILFLNVNTEKKHHVCYNLQTIYLREEDWKK